MPKIIKRLKDFFFGKKTDEEHGKKSPKEHGRKDFHEHSVSRKHKHEISGKLFRSASDSDLEVVKHHHRRSLHKKHVKDDYLKNSKHWKSRRHENKLPSICESSDRSGKLGSGSDGGKLALARSGKTTYNDITGHKNGDLRRANGHCKKDRKDTSEGSHSQDSSHSRRRHRRRSKEYQSLKKKCAKQHQSFENDLEKLEKLVELIGTKKTKGWLEQKVQIYNQIKTLILFQAVQVDYKTQMQLSGSTPMFRLKCGYTRVREHRTPGTRSHTVLIL